MGFFSNRTKANEISKTIADFFSIYNEQFYELSNTELEKENEYFHMAPPHLRQFYELKNIKRIEKSHEEVFKQRASEICNEAYFYQSDFPKIRLKSPVFFDESGYFFIKSGIKSYGAKSPVISKSDFNSFSILEPRKYENINKKVLYAMDQFPGYMSDSHRKKVLSIIEKENNKLYELYEGSVFFNSIYCSSQFNLLIFYCSFKNYHSEFFYSTSESKNSDELEIIIRSLKKLDFKNIDERGGSFADIKAYDFFVSTLQKGLSDFDYPQFVEFFKSKCVYDLGY